MKFELYKDVVLTRDLPEERLKRGGIVKLVEHHVACDGEDGYSAEVFNALGETLAVITVSESALEALRNCRLSRFLGSLPFVLGCGTRRRFTERGRKIAGTVQDADDFDPVRRDDVKENVAVENKSSHAAGHVVSAATDFGMREQLPSAFLEPSHITVCRVEVMAGDVFPDINQILVCGV
jgi:hypothetical protein